VRDLVVAVADTGRSSLDVAGRVVIWALFFATSVYGHVALKLAVGRGAGDGSYRRALVAAATSFWGWSAVAAWTLSCVFWVMALARQQLLTAASISALSYALLCAAACAFLGEPVTRPQVVGVALIVAGIFLVK
jgi:uncharacterized membrane protein